MKKAIFWTTCIGASVVGIGPFHLDPGGALGPDGPVSCMVFTLQLNFCQESLGG